MFTRQLLGLGLIGFASASPALHELLGRQSSTSPLTQDDIPTQCQSQCSTTITTINSCSTSTNFDCGCSVSAQNDLVNCFNCLLAITPSLTASIQNAVDSYTSGCKAAGVSLPAATVSGGTSLVTSTLRAGSGSATAAGTGIAGFTATGLTALTEAATNSASGGASGPSATAAGSNSGNGSPFAKGGGASRTYGKVEIGVVGISGLLIGWMALAV